MDPAAFDALSRRLARPTSRRLLMGAGALAAVAPFASAAGKRRKKKTKCVKLGAACGGRRKCCAGECRHHVCGCSFDKRQCGNKCIESFGCCGVSECPATQDPCLDPVCAANLCATTPKPGAPCGDDGLERCNDSGHCETVTCERSVECPGLDTACQSRVCTSGRCAFDYVSANTFVTKEPIGDCLQVVCNGVGGTMTVADIDDAPAGDECAIWCDGGIITRRNKLAGTPCEGGARQCDGAGHCV